MILILEMYSQLPDEEHKSLDNPSNFAQYSESNIDRQKFLDKFLNEHLKPEKQKEKQVLLT
jgi:hypothetical protein